MATQDCNVIENELSSKLPKSAVFSDADYQVDERDPRSSKMQQKDLRIRKTTNGSTKPLKATQNVPSFLGEHGRSSQASRAQTVTTTNKSQRN